MIKQIITTTTLIAAAATMANASDLAVGDTILVTFGLGTADATGAKTTTEAWYKGDDNKTYNILGANMTTSTSPQGWSDLMNSDNVATSIGLTSTGGNPGAGGGITAITGFPTDDGATIFRSEILKGDSPVEGSGNWSVRGGVNMGRTITFTGLTVGATYTLDVFAGRGNTFNSGSGTYSITGGTATSADLKNFRGTASNLGLTISATTSGTSKTATDWALMQFAFTAGSTTAGLSVDGFSNVGAMALTMTAIPEPSMFGLLAGLGALALVGARRRRK